MQAQTTGKEKELPFVSGEELNYDIRYKWGIIMAKAGTARFTMKESTYRAKPTFLSTLSFRTSSGFDKIFKIRDTLYSYSNKQLEPIFHRKHLNEGSTQYLETLTFSKFGKNETKALSARYNPDGEIRFEKELEAKELAFDMVNIFIFVRTLDYEKLTPGTSISVSSFVGRDVVKMQLRYVGQVILEKGSDKKYKTLKFEADVIDKAFETSKTALEMWVSDDGNRIPIKIKAKLKIGSAEAELSSFKGNKYPLSSLVVIKPRN